MSKYVALACALSLSGCIASSPPPPPEPRQPMSADVSFSKTWTAAVDVFTALNIPIKNLDRASGLIASDLVNVSQELDATHPADCGVLAVRLPISTVSYVVTVRGDSARSTVLASARWTHIGPKTFECTTAGVWERAFEDSVRRRIDRP